ncbi:DUF4231 domain-containing protein [Amycolatopsis sp., V23-08]|uniref:DUF4231 domain-containing protein n=1 Tax=Amycolatopsis heterodermiae TaxID=3110235 RepID=A0ABU5R973_9PSEU|nr:DUF4231 domain-containing protein [Amycolatopsis sp., V23-08]MEA5362773.1 DUF4231 domain-containing protein [Amycolatopsis sp., V23-08]
MTHRIREIEHHLAIARRRQRWSNVALVFGPVLLVVLYAIAWIPAVDRKILIAVYIPAVPIVFASCVASYFLKRNPGGPQVLAEGGGFMRESEGDLELALARHRDSRKQVLAQADIEPKVRKITYKEDAYSDVDQLREESKKYRSVNNTLQGVLIIGSLAATAASGIAAELAVVRWVTLGITFVVGISSGFMGYFKYKERSFYLQQTADAIEQEWEAVEIGVGRYKRMSEEEALAEFVEEVHRLKSEQKKRQQNLEQPPEARNPNDS